MTKQSKDLFSGFSKLSRAERFEKLVAMGALSKEDVAILNSSETLPIELAENFIENVIGYFQMPLGIAVNFHIDNKDYIIPMAVEETSIIAAASKTARMIKESGTITTKTIGYNSIGQIQIAKVKDFKHCSQTIFTHKDELIASANQEVAMGLVNRGGGVNDIVMREIKRPDGSSMAVIHVLVDACDAMGANIINQVCEFLKQPIETLTGETVTMSILSNMSDSRLSQAEVVIRNIEPETGRRIEEASLFGELDPYRAATNNKGVLNGMDPILLATGNDWRAVEAGIHAYACRDGRYRSITQWRMQGKDLHGTLTAPIMVGIVGGVTRLHPTAQLCLKMLAVNSAEHLARIIAAVGLVQNLGALTALATTGIIQGHMKLHIDNLALSVGADQTEVPILKQRLQQTLATNKRISLHNAQDILNEIRAQNGRNQ